MSPYISIDVDLDDVLSQSDIEDVIKYYGVDDVLSEMDIEDIIAHIKKHDHLADILDGFKEEEIREYLQDGEASE